MLAAEFLSVGEAAPDGADCVGLHQPGRENDMVDRDQRTKGHVAHPTRMHEPSLLLTDLYEFSMLEAYAAHGMAETAVLEVFVRKLPAGRGFLMAAGLAQVVDFLETMRFSSHELGWLGASGMFSPAFVEGLADLYFTAASGPTGRDPADQPGSFSDDHRL